jgi:hypothetical protein
MNPVRAGGGLLFERMHVFWHRFDAWRARFSAAVRGSGKAIPALVVTAQESVLAAMPS